MSVFTGIVEVMGLVTEFEAREGAWRLTVKAGPGVNRSRVGDRVNLERPIRLGAPLGGHLVLGHVDGVGTLTTLIPDRDTVRARIRVPDPSLMRYCIPKGSVAVDGVSLTVAALDDESFEVMLIPYTLAVTTLGQKAEGARVNLEMDVIGKYLYRFSRHLLQRELQRSVE